MATTRNQTTGETMEKLFHYTVGKYVPNILATGAIELATDLVPQDVRAAAWASLRGDWEPVCNKLLMTADGPISLTRAETEIAYRGLVRIQIDPAAAPHSWREYCALSGDSRAMIRGLERAARKQGSNVKQYRCSFEPIPASAWIGFEIRKNGTWVSLELELVN